MQLDQRSMVHRRTRDATCDYLSPLKLTDKQKHAKTTKTNEKYNAWSLLVNFLRFVSARNNNIIPLIFFLSDMAKTPVEKLFVFSLNVLPNICRRSYDRLQKLRAYFEEKPAPLRKTFVYKGDALKKRV